MKIEQEVSTNIVDRRRSIGLGALGGILATLLAWFGVRALTGTERDPDRDMVFVVSTALDNGQRYWKTKFEANQYRPARIVLFERATGSGCGRALSQSGPFYCATDERIYLDLAFLKAIRGDLARAYVIYHELGHHVQKLAGAELQGGFSVELAADCLAGEVMRWEMLSGNLASGDIEAALAEAARVGDDVIRSEAPETWTHGTADMRVGAVTAGLSGGGCRL